MRAETIDKALGVLEGILEKCGGPGSGVPGPCPTGGSKVPHPIGTRVAFKDDPEAKGTITHVHLYSPAEHDDQMYTVKLDHGGHEIAEHGELRKIKKGYESFEKCESTGKPGPCSTNKPKPQGPGKPEGKKPEPAASGKKPQGGISNVNTAKKREDRPGAKELQKEIENLRKAHANFDRLPKAVKLSAITARDGAYKALKEAEARVRQQQDKMGIQVIAQSRTRIAGTVKRMTGRIQRMSAAVARLKQVQPAPPKKELDPKDEERVLLKSSVINHLEGVMDDADELHKEAEGLEVVGTEPPAQPQQPAQKPAGKQPPPAKKPPKQRALEVLDKIGGLLEKCGGPGGTPGPCPTGGGDSHSVAAHAVTRKAHDITSKVGSQTQKKRAGEANEYSKQAKKAAESGNFADAMRKHNLAFASHEYLRQSHGKDGHKEASKAHEDAAKAHDKAAEHYFSII